MAIKISNTTVIDNDRNVVNVEGIGDSNTVYYGDGSNLSGIIGGAREFVASGAIDNGDAVVINTDGTVSVVTSTNLTSENYIGIAAEAISDGSTGEITTFGGVNSSQTGLTAARTYYVQTDGSLGLTAGTPSVVAGKSISSTKIIVA